MLLKPEALLVTECVLFVVLLLSLKEQGRYFYLILGQNPVVYQGFRYR
ncbi:Uncharacterised protein [Vibrio cholerae]|nr:Uncharacterised protein [Vibrio cholerae]